MIRVSCGDEWLALKGRLNTPDTACLPSGVRHKIQRVPGTNEAYEDDSAVVSEGMSVGDADEVTDAAADLRVSS